MLWPGLGWHSWTLGGKPGTMSNSWPCLMATVGRCCLRHARTKHGTQAVP